MKRGLCLQGLDRSKDVHVVSSADEVELLLNGKSLGKIKPSHRFLFTFENIRLEPGILTAIGPSFKVTRVTVPVTRVTAGANAEKAAAVFDDNEETTWTNDNQLGSSWISCELAREANLSEVALELSGRRRRRYPLRISPDGREVYRDLTPLSLGYVTLPLQPARGKILRIELLRPAITGDGFDIRELANPNNASTGAKGMGKGSLGIVEIDCFEPASQ